MADNDDPNDVGNQWITSLVTNEQRFGISKDDAGNRYLTNEQIRQIERGIKEVLAEDDTLKNLSIKDAGQKMLANPNLYQPKVVEKIFGPTLVQSIKRDQAKRRLYSNY